MYELNVMFYFICNIICKYSFLKSTLMRFEVHYKCTLNTGSFCYLNYMVSFIAVYAFSI